MISYLQIENFKSLHCVSFPLTNLNLFFGENGGGKSSVIQSLLLLRQSYFIWRNYIPELLINGKIIQLGTAKDIFCQNAEEDYIRLLIRYNHETEDDFRFRYEDFRPEKDNLRSYNITDLTPKNPDEAIFSKKFLYIGADHISPRSEYSTAGFSGSEENLLGSHGEYAVPYLAKYGNSVLVADQLLYPGTSSKRLIDQVEAWLKAVSHKIRISAEFNELEQAAKLNIAYEGERLVTNNISPVNVGFGIPYVLPLILQLLISDNNSLILIENPESHLHPKAQSVIADLISRAAQNGAQIICESHSDHIINGIRVAVKKEKLDCNKLAVAYFDRKDNLDTRVNMIEVDRNGNLSSYPVGLLDEWENLMAELI